MSNATYTESPPLHSLPSCYTIYLQRRFGLAEGGGHYLYPEVQYSQHLPLSVVGHYRHHVL